MLTDNDRYNAVKDILRWITREPPNQVGDFTHKEMKSLGRILGAFIDPGDGFISDFPPEVHLLMEAIAAPGLNIQSRKFAAELAIAAINKKQQEKEREPKKLIVSYNEKDREAAFASSPTYGQITSKDLDEIPF